jgi:L-threonylcarbamoyladenylate synthase
MSVNFTPLFKAAALLREGGVGVFPTETVYGLGASALDTRACARIFEVKQRPHFNPLIVHVADRAALLALVTEVPAGVHALLDAFTPGPLTLVLPKRGHIPDIVTAGLSTVGLRIPRHPVAQALLAEAGVPIAAPSANRFMSLSPTSAAHVAAEILANVDFFLDGGDAEVGLESTIIGWVEGRPCLLRPGGISREEIEAVIGPVARATGDSPIVAPGMLKRHYSPRTPLYVWDKNPPTPITPRCVLLRFAGEITAGDRAAFSGVEVLSTSGDLKSAAARIFRTLAQLDGAGYDAIYAERAPEQGLGIAINDRLGRASRSP